MPVSSYYAHPLLFLDHLTSLLLRILYLYIIGDILSSIILVKLSSWTLEFYHFIYLIYKFKIYFMTYKPQKSHTDQPNFCNWLADGQRDNGIGIMLVNSINVDSINQIATSQSNSYPIVLTRLGEPRSKPNLHGNCESTANWRLLLT